MFKKKFNTSSKDDAGDHDNAPSMPEVRRVPYYAQNIQTPDKNWITSHVFVDPKNKNKRIYYVARSFRGWDWKIYEYHYSTDDTVLLKALRDYTRAFESTIQKIANLEKEALTQGLIPVPGLRGNYREVANLAGRHFDDHGNYIKVDQDKPITRDALFDRKSLEVLYRKTKSEPAAPLISTWDDFYREIVHARPLDEISPKSFQEIRSSPMFQECKHMLDAANDFERKMTDDKTSPQSKKYPHHLRINKLSRQTASLKNAGYHYDVVILTAMMRAGNTVFQHSMNSIPVSGETIQLLSDIGDTIYRFARERLDCSRDQAQQIVDVILQGPDPYVDKPLPLEAWVKKFSAPPSATAKNSPPAPHPP